MQVVKGRGSIRSISMELPEAQMGRGYSDGPEILRLDAKGHPKFRGASGPSRLCCLLRHSERRQVTGHTRRPQDGAELG